MSAAARPTSSFRARAPFAHSCSGRRAPRPRADAPPGRSRMIGRVAALRQRAAPWSEQRSQRGQPPLRIRRRTRRRARRPRRGLGRRRRRRRRARAGRRASASAFKSTARASCPGPSATFGSIASRAVSRRASSELLPSDSDSDIGVVVTCRCRRLRLRSTVGTPLRLGLGRRGGGGAPLS